MKSTLTIRLDADMKRRLDSYARKVGRTPSDLARELLRRQVALHEFEELRGRILPFADAGGCLTDEDVFRDIS